MVIIMKRNWLFLPGPEQPRGYGAPVVVWDRTLPKNRDLDLDRDLVLLASSFSSSSSSLYLGLWILQLHD